MFTAHDGFESYSATFHVDWQEEGGKWHTLELTPRTYRGLQSPYNRRNAYGAAISYAPVLVSNPRTRPMLNSVSRFGFCGGAPLLSELGIPRDRVVYPLYVRLEPRDGASRSPKWQREFRISCE